MSSRSTKVVLVLLALSVLWAAARKVGDFDLPWHMAVGRAAIATRGLVAHDDFSYTFRGAPTPQEYLSDIGFYLIERLGGAIGLQLLGLLAIGGLVALLVLRAREVLPAAAATAAVALAVSAPWLTVRPAIVSPLLFALELHWIDRYRNDRNWKRLIWLIPIQLIWANAHGFAVLGAALCAGFAGYTLACRIARGRLGALLPERDGVALPTVAAISLAAVAATLASSHGLSIFAGPFVASSHRGLVAEWAPTTLAFVLAEDPLLLLLGFLTLAALVFGRDPDRLPSLFPVAVILGSAALGLSAVRLIPIFAVAVAPFIARRLWPLPSYQGGGRAVILLCVLVPFPSLLLSRTIHHGVGWDYGVLPEGAVGFAEKNHLTGPVWNRLGYGGWLIWRLYPDVRVFIDGRTGWLYPFDFMHDYRRGNDDPKLFAVQRERWGFEWAIVGAGPEDRYAAVLSDDRRWALVYLDDVAAIYVRGDGPNAELARRGYQKIRHGTLLQYLLAHPPQPGAIDHDAALALSQSPAGVRAHVLAAVADIAHHDLASARMERAILRDLDPDNEAVEILDEILPN